MQKERGRIYSSCSVPLGWHGGRGGLEVDGDAEVGGGAGAEEREEKIPEEKEDGDKESGVGEESVEGIIRCSCTMDGT